MIDLDLLDIPPVLWSADDCDRAATELRAARKVVEAALDLRAEVDVNAIGSGYPSIGTARTFDAAVAELEALK